MSDAHNAWGKLSAPLDPKDISWRIDSKPKARDGKFFARFVCYVEAGTVRERLDSVVPGEWDLTLELLPETADAEGVRYHAFKARLQVLGVIREDVGQGPDYKQAATDAFKRAAVRFGIGHELYAMEQNWVEVDGDGKFAKAVEDPQKAYERRYGGRAVLGQGRENGYLLAMERSDERNGARPTSSWAGQAIPGSSGGMGDGKSGSRSAGVRGDAHMRQSQVRESGSSSGRDATGEHPRHDSEGALQVDASEDALPSGARVHAGEHHAREERNAAVSGVRERQAAQAGRSGAVQEGDPVVCPKCSGPVWDNRATKKNPKAPDYKCRDKTCDGVIWPPRESKGNAMDPQDYDETEYQRNAVEDDDSLPF